MFYSEKEAFNFLEDNHMTIFSRNEKLSLLYTEKIEENFYLIKSNLDLSKKSFSRDSKINLPKEFTDLQIISEIGSNFYPISNYPGSIKLSSGNEIRNNVRKIASGSLAFIFTINNSPEYYIISNNHVIGRKCRTGDIIQKVLPKNKYKNIGFHLFGEINSHIDIAIAKLTSERTYNEANYIDINFNLMDNDSIQINNIQQEIKSLHAYAKVSDDYFYKPYKILKNQILSNKKMSPGHSGSLVYDNLKKASGVIFAVNSNYSLINKFEPIIEYISKMLNTNPNKIKIINQINI